MGKGGFHLTRLDIAIDDRNDKPYFTVEQIKNKCLKDEFNSKSKSYRFNESSFDKICPMNMLTATLKTKKYLGLEK